MVASLTVAPAAPYSGSTATLNGAGFPIKTRVRITRGGTNIATLRTTGTGAFKIGCPFPAPGSIDVVVSTYPGGVTLLTKPVTVSDAGSVTGWNLVFRDTFDDRTVALGHFKDGATDLGSLGIRTADGRYLIRRQEWLDTSHHGTRGDANIVEISGGTMKQHVYTDSSGFGHNCIMGPLGTGATSEGGLNGCRFLIRFKGPNLYGHKSVPLLWPDIQGGSDSPNKYGEVDMAEASWDKVPKAYMHGADGSATGHQSFFSYPSGVVLQDMHTWVTEWVPGVSVKYFVDGTLSGTVTQGQVIGGVVQNIPVQLMHPVMQFETSLDGEIPIANTSGIIEIEEVALWVPA